MLRGIYSVAGAMEAAARNQEIIAENLTNAVTPGYRRQGSAFDLNSAPVASANNEVAAGTQSAGSSNVQRGYSSFEPGPVQQTNNPLDLALVGNAFFVLQGPTGPLYSRNGSFERSPSGELQTRGGGYLVSGSGGGSIRVPAEASQIAVAKDGTVTANGNQIGRLQLAAFDRTDGLRRVGATLFEADNPQPPPASAVRVEQGYREGSNVQPVQEMVSMMVGMRYYEASERALRSISDAISQNTRAQDG